MFSLQNTFLHLALLKLSWKVQGTNVITLVHSTWKSEIFWRLSFWHKKYEWKIQQFVSVSQTSTARRYQCSTANSKSASLRYAQCWLQTNLWRANKNTRRGVLSAAVFLHDNARLGLACNRISAAVPLWGLTIHSIVRVSLQRFYLLMAHNYRSLTDRFCYCWPLDFTFSPYS